MMARPTKAGLDYFPLDTVMDTKVKLIEAQFGIKGFAVYIRLLQRIYGENGYYMEWSDDIGMLFSQEADENCRLVSDIVKRMIDRDLFDRKLYETYGVLTSHGIQKRYIEATKKRQCVEINPNYDLLSVTDAVSSDNNPVNAAINSQSKAKESKEKQIIKKQTKPNNNKQKQTKPNDIKAQERTAACAVDCALYADYWNHNVAEKAGLTPVKPAAKWREERRRALCALVTQAGSREVLNAFDRVVASDFLCGRSGGWRASFDWVINPVNFEKITEGNYDNAKPLMPGAKELTYYDRVILGMEE